MTKIVAFLLAVLVVIGLTLLAAWPFMWIWNYAVVAAISVAKPLEYWPAYWLTVFLTLYIRSTRTSKK